MSLRLSLLLSIGLVAASFGAPIDFEKEIRPLLTEYCNKCHSTDKQKGDLDLERFTTFEAVKADPNVWELVAEQLELGEMPPKDKEQLEPGQKLRLTNWVHESLAEIARAQAGDPGPVVLRRLSNAEYTYTVRDLTGVDALNPLREFPVDGAAGEGFTNTGAALVMSPSLLAKYLDAAKDIASHAVLLPDGVRFSPHTTARDWTDDSLSAIRGFYARFTGKGGGTQVNLQGVKFDTNSGGVLPLEDYLAATLAEKAGLASGAKSIAGLAGERGLNAKYLGALWAALNGLEPSPVLDPIRTKWRQAKPEDAPALAAEIGQWQKALWRFATVGQIGKRDGPKAWQLPVTPVESAREFKIKLSPPADGKDVTLYLVASDAGDGNANDHAIWENPRLTAEGRPDLALRDVRAAVGTVMAYREKVFSSAAECLAAVDEIAGSPDAESVARVAKKRNVDPVAVAAWLECLGLSTAESRIDSLLTQKTRGEKDNDFIAGWKGVDPLSVVANPSDKLVRIPGYM
ncbi:MAG TPA: DUF1587 domain-containing protein, partial [Chthoniobacteraceae bacterium]|nr:DUF1587 domain-containing protein [Chthoniobacteraceae bacterium]